MDLQCVASVYFISSHGYIDLISQIIYACLCVRRCALLRVVVGDVNQARKDIIGMRGQEKSVLVGIVRGFLKLCIEFYVIQAVGTNLVL